MSKKITFKRFFLKLLKNANPRTIVFTVGFFFIMLFTVIGLIKISASGGMAKAQKDAQIAYNSAVEKNEKDKLRKEEETTALSSSNISKNVDKTENTSSEMTTETAYSNYYSDAEKEAFIKEFYSKAVFVGDSVMYGFSNYCVSKEDDSLGGPVFLAAGSFSLYHALSDAPDAILPTYKGEKMKVETALSKMPEANKVFLFFGINDFNMVHDPKNDVYKNFDKLINRILEVRNDIQINVISTTYVLSGHEVGSLTNENIALLNQKMKNYCLINGYGFVNVADSTGSETGGLNPDFCSDSSSQGIHQTNSAYDVWTSVLESFAISN